MIETLRNYIVPIVFSCLVLGILLPIIMPYLGAMGSGYISIFDIYFTVSGLMWLFIGLFILSLPTPLLGKVVFYSPKKIEKPRILEEKNVLLAIKINKIAQKSFLGMVSFAFWVLLLIPFLRNVFGL